MTDIKPLDQNPELVDLWIEKLTDGSYVQGTDYLRTVESDGTIRHCCLGVLCDIVDPNGWGAGLEWGESLHPKFVYKDSESVHHLPNALCSTLGIDNVGRSITWDSEIGLAGMNDHGASFAEIADVIRSRFPNQEDTTS